MKKYPASMLVLAVIGAIIVTGAAVYLSTKQRQPSLPEGWEWYHNDEYNYRIGHPADWEYLTIAGFPFFRESETGANFVVGVDLPVTMSLEEYAVACKQSIRVLFGENVIFLSERKITAPREGYEIVYEQTCYGEVWAKQRASLFIHKGKGYVLTCTVPQIPPYDAETAYEMYTEVFNKIVNSLVIRS